MTDFPTRGDFPGDFTFGAATAAFQIEGGQGSETGRGPSIWDDFSATPGNVLDDHDGRTACDHYGRWESDLDLLRGGGFDAYRFSISWPRVQPDGAGAVNAAGLDFYERLVDGMLERGLRPFATLYHWDLPSVLEDRGGWRSREVPERFADYAAIVARRLGDRLHSTATLNEPWCTAWLSHMIGRHAPGVRDIRAAARAMHHVGVAHGLGVRAMRAEGLGNLGIVTNHEAVVPFDGTPEASEAARTWDGILNRWFWEGLHRGQYPADILERLAPHMPDGFEGDMAIVGTPTDWHGVNYYTRSHWLPDPATTLWPAIRQVDADGPKTALGWEVHPDGLREVLERTAGYTGGLPLYVTENGAAFNDPAPGNGRVEDPDRVAYFAGHLRAARDAIDRGVPLRGYFAWSLLDNFEWAEGYNGRFGICHVDFATLKRTPKASYHAFRHMLGGT